MLASPAKLENIDRHDNDVVQASGHLGRVPAGCIANRFLGGCISIMA